MAPAVPSHKTLPQFQTSQKRKGKIARQARSAMVFASSSKLLCVSTGFAAAGQHE